MSRRWRRRPSSDPDLIPIDNPSGAELIMPDDWAERLDQMEDWYRELLAGGEQDAQRSLDNDYLPHRAFLTQLAGRVLDVGGGAGLAARFLPPGCDYCVIDPAVVWGEPKWRDFAAKYRAKGSVSFVEGTGEDLPFADASFDAALALWSLNHARDAGRCMREMTRVVRPRGVLLIVLEDVVPTLKDIAVFAAKRLANRLGGNCGDAQWGQPGVASIGQTLSAKVRGRWPLQADHLLISEREFRRWLKPELTIAARQWRGGSLTFELVREP